MHCSIRGSPCPVLVVYLQALNALSLPSTHYSPNNSFQYMYLDVLWFIVLPSCPLTRSPPLYLRSYNSTISQICWDRLALMSHDFPIIEFACTLLFFKVNASFPLSSDRGRSGVSLVWNGHIFAFRNHQLSAVSPTHQVRARILSGGRREEKPLEPDQSPQLCVITLEAGCKLVLYPAVKEQLCGRCVSMQVKRTTNRW